MVYLNVPYHAPLFWQVFLAISAWTRPTIGLIDLHFCPSETGACGPFSWFIVFSSAIGQAALAMFALGLDRFFAMIGFVQFFALFAAFYFKGPDTGAYVRNAMYCESPRICIGIGIALRCVNTLTD